MMFVDVVKAICVSVIVKVLISNFHSVHIIMDILRKRFIRLLISCPNILFP